MHVLVYKDCLDSDIELSEVQCLKIKHIEMIENAYDKLDGIEKFQISAIFYVSGFLASKYSQLQSTSGGFGEECAFTDLVSRGKLSYPTQELFAFVKVCFVVFEEIKNELSNGSFQKPRDYLITLSDESSFLFGSFWNVAKSI